MREILPELLIFSVERPTQTAREREMAHAEVEDVLTTNSIPFGRIKGAYEGAEEDSYLVLAKGAAESLVKEICQSFSQECYLRRTNDGEAFLVDPRSGEEKHVGQLVQLSKKEATAGNAPSYSYCEQTGYWGLK